jgi:hypothetical protein
VATAEIEPLLSFTRAWRLVKFVDRHAHAQMRRMQRPVRDRLAKTATSPAACNPPARAGKSKDRWRADAALKFEPWPLALMQQALAAIN